MTKEMKKILFANTRKFVIDHGSLETPENVVLALTVNHNLQQKYNMTLDSSAIRALSTQTAQEMAQTWKELDSILADVTGSSAFKGELFYRNFPEEVMEMSEAQLYLNSLFYYTFSQSNDELSLAIANELKNMMTEEKQDRLPLLEQFPRELGIINKGTEEDLFKMMNARVHSLNMSEHQYEELKKFASVYKEKFTEILESDTPFQSKESKVKLALMLHDEGRDAELSHLMRDAVDVLRFAAMLSKKHGIWQNNVELKSPVPSQEIAFKLNKSEKRLIKNLLDGCPGLFTDIWHQEKLFKRLMNRLDTKEEKCPENVRTAFDNLASNKKVDKNGRPIYNPNKLIPEAIKHLNETGDITKLENLAKNRPGEFLRSYISSVSHTDEKYRQSVIDMVKYCVDSSSIAMKNLLTAREQLSLHQLANTKLANDEAIAKVYKHHGKHYVKANMGVKLSNAEIEQMKEALQKTAAEMVKGYQALGKVYIAPELTNVKAPGREMRGASGGSVLTPYSTIDADGNKNMLMFGINWGAPKGNKARWIDVDLAVHAYSNDYKNLGRVSYYELKTPWGVHSGDYTQIPENGTSTEAIAVDKTKLKECGVRYLVAEVHCYSIKSFRDAGNCKFIMEQKEGSFDGWNTPIRDRYGYNKRQHYNNALLGNANTMSNVEEGHVMFMGEVFEPSQLENCITLNSDGTTTVPMYYDVDEDRFHWLDMTITQGNAMPRYSDNPFVMTQVMSEIEIAQNNPYPDMKSLFECYAMHNGELVDDITQADTVFVRNNVDREKLGIQETARVITAFDLDIISKEFSGNDDQSMLLKEETREAVEEKKIEEPALVKQLRYFHQKLDEFPRGSQWHRIDVGDRNR